MHFNWKYKLSLEKSYVLETFLRFGLWAVLLFAVRMNTISGWRHAYMSLYIFAKKRLVGEVEHLCYFLDRLLRMFQLIFYLFDGIFIDPFSRSMATDFLNGRRDVFG